MLWCINRLEGEREGDEVHEITQITQSHLVHVLNLGADCTSNMKRKRKNFFPRYIEIIGVLV